jgi:hypothetical protein
LGQREKRATKNHNGDAAKGGTLARQGCRCITSLPEFLERSWVVTSGSRGVTVYADDALQFRKFF